ncbi:MAG: gliding motility-associated C-terminal domain-containing protein, partial [Bacteroidales bacterium]|nr:gliding motility-associated C-terminal domain-containing protein [Bacteroidales bacterium]
GCRDTLTIHVTVKPAPYLNLGEDLYLFSCDPIILDAGGGDGSDFYEWQDGSTKRTLKVYGNGTYWVRVFNEGCAVVDTIKVQLCEGFIYVPDAFTPNNDGLNDMFKVITTDPTIHFHIYIYNRHGQLVFQTDDIEKGWDGKIDGEMAPADVYVYLIEYRGNGTHSPGVTKTLKGSFILVR